MAYLRFYHPTYPAFRDESENEAYNRFVHDFNNDCNCNNTPAANIYETDKEYHVEMALPGVDKKNIRVKSEKDLLTISVEKRENNEHENFTHHEFDFAGTCRTFKLGDRVETGNIAAKYNNGILHLTLSKKEAYVNKPAQSIAIE